MRVLFLAALLVSCTAAPPAPDAPSSGDAPTADAGADTGSTEVDTGAPPDAPRELDAPSDPDAGPARPARLRVEGPTVVDPSGASILLRGYNWGQFGTAIEEDGRANREQGANSVRLPLRWWGDWRDGVDSRDPDAPGRISESHLATLDATIEWASAAGLWVILFVDSNYGQGASGDVDFWNEPTMRAEFWDVWRFLVARYRDREGIGAYEILPEPRHDGPNADVRAFYEEGIAVIRELDPVTPIVVGPNDGYHIRNIEDAYTTVDANLLYTANLFIFMNTEERVPDFAAFRDRHDVPIWVNQVGIDDDSAEALASADGVLRALDGADVGFAWWTYRSRTTARAAHGIYFTSATGVWERKDEWFDLLGTWLAR